MKKQIPDIYKQYDVTHEHPKITDFLETKGFGCYIFKDYDYIKKEDIYKNTIKIYAWKGKIQHSIWISIEMVAESEFLYKFLQVKLIDRIEQYENL